MIAFVTQNMAPLMFVGLILFMVIGYPAAFSLAAVGLFFGFIGIELGLIRSDFLGNLTFQLYAIISNEDSGDVSVIDVLQDDVAFAIPVGKRPRGVRASRWRSVTQVVA